MNYAKIKEHDISNGPGVRASLFVSGCTHKCPGCFNEEAQDFNYGKPWTKEVEDAFIEHLKNPDIVGINLLGGEPLQQVKDDTLIDLIDRICKEVNKPIWLWTGYEIDKLIQPNNHSDEQMRIWNIISSCDVVIDGKFIEAEKDLSLKYRGSRNQRIIDIKKSIKQAALASGYPMLMSEYLIKLEGF